MATLPIASSLTNYIPPWLSDCLTCKAIWHLFTDPGNASQVNLGSYQEAISTTCQNHKELVLKFTDYVLSESSDSGAFENNDLGLYQQRKGDSIRMTRSLSHLGTGWNLLLLNKDHIPGHPGKGRLLDVDWADTKALRKWKDKCIRFHGAKCENPLKVWPARPDWLIDVQNQCIVPGHIASNYVAISYTYGKHTPPKITSNDFIRLQKPSSLITTELSDYVSPIIRHAMYLTSVIDEQYLWADALCITHHDSQAASEQPKSMGAIYANAVVTIVAADSDSGSGFHGLEGVSSSREINQDIIPFGDEKLVIRNTYMMDMMLGPQDYYDRGWTFQEYAMSKRKIVFHNLELHWLCTCSVWHEELTLYTGIDNEVFPRSNFLMAGFPDQWSLGRYLVDYNHRSLTYDEDAFPAISGLLSVLSRSFEGGFLYGIPEMFFDHGLCWRPDFNLNLQRRVPSARPIKNRFASSDLPSWSWLGWVGAVSMFNQTAIKVNEKVHCIEEALPITEWYTSSSVTDPVEARRRIRSTWYENRDVYKDLTNTMPLGWTRRDTFAQTSHHEELLLYPDGCERYVFSHEAMPGHFGKPAEWYYPFPVKGIQPSTLPFMPEQTQYLFCETTQAKVLGLQQDLDESESWRDNEIKLCDISGKEIGNLYLVDEESKDRFPNIVDGIEIGLPIDVVAVCKLKTCSKTWNQEENKYGFPFIKKESYAVLWVEWKDGIAYRVASGKVTAAEWEQLGLERVSLVLG
ncbi:hypothetical protein FSPOR_11896 [Fusarium sporotrichioides]|uniref:Heterokaryon incompatibility domain-containing protein n=1 Tax=Fusarium sporotrichioides TaxID=5514 RepID=A0A395RE69_FUSSP|nr:hypothetical protein FSPOR_11896 [Fusarium sporotrichioides]